MKWLQMMAVSALVLGCSGCCVLRPRVSAREPALTHVVLVWLKADVSAADRAAVEQGSRELAAIPGVHDLVVGKALASDRPIVEDSFDLALSMRFVDKAAMEAYVVHPDHQAFLKMAKPHIQRVMIVDFVDTVPPWQDRAEWENSAIGVPF